MRTLFLSTALLLAACSTSKEATAGQAPQASQPPEAIPVKPGAPTTLEAQVTGGTAKLTLRFAGAGEQVDVSVRGLDGVEVSSGGSWLTGAKVEPGQVLEQTVGFAASARGQLVISVEGVFSAARRARVHTVAVGEGPVKKDLGAVQKTTDGDAVKLIP
jgi:hypothetical protein